MTDQAQHVEPMLPPKARRHQIIRRFRVEPADVGIDGFVGGARLLAWIEKAGHANAARWSHRRCVVVSVGNLHLDRPISAGEFVELHASLVYARHSSMHILVTVYSGDPAEADGLHTTQCPIIFVAVDANGTAVEVPRWTPVTMLELQRQRQARVRISTRTRIEDAMAAEDYLADGAALRVTRRFLAAPADGGGNAVHGGQVLRWIDESAHACGSEWTGAHVVTSYVAGIRFCRPIGLGDNVEVTARVVHTGPRSVHIAIHVTAASRGAEPILVAQGLVVVVARDGHGRALPVPTWKPAAGEDLRLDRHARSLIELRHCFEPFTTATAVTEPARFHRATVTRARRAMRARHVVSQTPPAA